MNNLVEVQSAVIPPPETITDKEKRIAESIINPDLFAEHWLNATLWNKQREIMQAVAIHPKVAVKACHSSSKTYTAARIVLWFLARYDDSLIITTAPTWNQVEKALWGEVHSALEKSRFPFPSANRTELRLGPKRLAYGLSTSVTKQDEGVKFQGFHSANVLVILDEAPGVDPKIWEAIEGARAGGNVRVLALGNPTIASGPFHDAFSKDRDDWKVFTIDAFDTPNLTGLTLEQLLVLSQEDLDRNICPYLTTRRWVKEMYYEWGPGHPSWEARVRGNFPKQSPDALLSLTWIEEAAKRTVPEGDEWEAGIDVAGPGEDETSLTIRAGNKIVYHKQWTKDDPRGYVVEALNLYKDKLKAVKVDCIGLGWGMYQHLKDLDFPALPVNVCMSATDSEKYRDLKSEYYWSLRQRFQAGEIGADDGVIDSKTIGQLAGIRYAPTAKGQTEIESKQDAAKRGVKSPDRAESIMLAFAAKTTIYGVLEYYKQMDKVQSAQLAKPATPDNKVSCPKCVAICIAPNNNGWRCNNCGHQWTDKKQLPAQMPVNRNDLIKRANNGTNQRRF